jgi:GTPase
MKFLYEVTIEVRSGKGGDGMAHLRRMRFQPKGGPDGGNGGRGGDVVLVAERGRNTLLHLRFNPVHRSEPGQPGGTNDRTGRGGEDNEIQVPVGTTVRREADGTVLTDLTEHGQRFVAAKGGRGGPGNAAYKSATNRTPLEAKQGGPGETQRLALELRLMADVGLVGLPNAGKSTLISRISAARPRVADYPFTTLEPSLGVVRFGDHGAFVVADLPGLIEGAHEGQGLGHRFLRHVERTAVFLHMVTVEPDAPDGEPLERFNVVRDEVVHYRADLAERPALIALTKIDTLHERDDLAQLAAAMEAATGHRTIPISSVSGEGLDELVATLGALVEREREREDE